MKKVKFFSMLTAAALLVGVTSCNNDDDLGGGDNNIVKGEPTAMSLTIKTPSVPATYAQDGNATVDEMELKTINVLIYAETSSGSGSYILEKNAALTMADFDPLAASSDTYALKAANSIRTTTGNKKIYVAMNFSATLPSTGDNHAQLAGLVHTLSSAGELSSNGIAMFSVESKDAALVAETTPGTTPAANKVSISVKRMVAKVTVQESAGLRTSGEIISQGGKLSNLQFAVGNANKTIYPLQKRVGTSPNIVVQDNNWATFSAGDFFGISSTALASTDYKTVDAAGTGALLLKAAYAPENTADVYNVDGDNLTYLSVRAQYQPGFFVDGTGTAKPANTAAAKSFWTMTKTDGSILYFETEAEADAYKTNVDPTANKSVEYKDGLCYFRAYINKNATPDGNISGSVVKKFDVLRNNFYKATINSIKAPGVPTDEGKVTEETSLIVNVDVEPWAVVSDDYDL